ncbi:tetratricopeptide repeat protein [Saccharothrix lopnurensis]|uniref:Tetratricopeptide repeat protein n=1 Tax=Saccharothrix lopnurensis TaxID=1670621 RepID=A0ABW1P0G7_9PSEU
MVISAVDGTGGVGKTALAVHWARRVERHFPDGTLFVNLRGYGPGDALAPSEVLESFLGALGVAPDAIPAGLEAQAALYRSVLTGRRVLVVLDNSTVPANGSCRSRHGCSGCWVSTRGPAPISVHAAAALADVGLPVVRRLLEALIDAHLLERTGRDRYHLHDLLRVYAAGQVDGNDAGAHKRAGDHGAVVAAPVHLAMALSGQGRHDEAVRTCERVLGELDERHGGPPDTAEFFEVFGTSLRAVGEVDRACEFRQRALALYEVFDLGRAAEVRDQLDALRP